MSPFRMKNQNWQNVGIPLEYDGQEQDMKALAKQLKISLGRLMWQSLHTLYKSELESLHSERIESNGN